MSATSSRSQDSAGSRDRVSTVAPHRARTPSYGTTPARRVAVRRTSVWMRHRRGGAREVLPGWRHASLAAVLVVGGLVAPSGVPSLAAAETDKPSLVVQVQVEPRSPPVGAHARIDVHASLRTLRGNGSCCRRVPLGGDRRVVRVDAISPSGGRFTIALTRSGRYLWRGHARFPQQGRWLLRLRNPMPGVPTDPGRERRWIRVRPPVPTPAPPGFGPLGRLGCRPPSPRNTAGEVFGTATQGQLWAAFGGFPSEPGLAVFDDMLGEPVKILIRFTGVAPIMLFVVAPDGARVPLIAQAHSSSDWDRPGQEWGTGHLFTEPGCWQLHVSDGRTAGDIWFVVRS